MVPFCSPETSKILWFSYILKSGQSKENMGKKCVNKKRNISPLLSYAKPNFSSKYFSAFYSI